MAFVGSAGLAAFQCAYGVASRIPAPIREISYIRADPEFEIANWPGTTLVFSIRARSRFTPDCRTTWHQAAVIPLGRFDSCIALSGSRNSSKARLIFELAQYTKGRFVPPSLRVPGCRIVAPTTIMCFSVAGGCAPGYRAAGVSFGDLTPPGLRDLIARLRLLEDPTHCHHGAAGNVDNWIAQRRLPLLYDPQLSG